MGDADSIPMGLGGQQQQMQVPESEPIKSAMGLETEMKSDATMTSDAATMKSDATTMTIMTVARKDIATHSLYPTKMPTTKTAPAFMPTPFTAGANSLYPTKMPTTKTATARGIAPTFMPTPF